MRERCGAAGPRRSEVDLQSGQFWHEVPPSIRLPPGATTPSPEHWTGLCLTATWRWTLETSAWPLTSGWTPPERCALSAVCARVCMEAE